MPLLDDTFARKYSDVGAPQDMDDDRERDEQGERPRPRIVDKRVSARREQDRAEPAHTGAPTEPEAPPEPPPQTGAPADSGVPPEQAPAGGGPEAAGADAGPAPGERVWTPEEEAQAQQMAREIAERPSSDWVLNVAVTLANVAGAKIQLGAADDARLAIDALEALVDGVGARIEGAEAPLRQTLAQLQLAFAQQTQPPESPAK